MKRKCEGKRLRGTHLQLLKKKKKKKQLPDVKYSRMSRVNNIVITVCGVRWVLDLLG